MYLTLGKRRIIKDSVVNAFTCHPELRVMGKSLQLVFTPASLTLVRSILSASQLILERDLQYGPSP